MLYPGHRLIAGGCILIEPPCVCLAPFLYISVEFHYFLLLVFKQRIFLVDPELLGWEICAERFEDLASVINFRVCGGKSVEKCRISVARGCFIEYYLWRKIEVDTLYFSANSWLTTPRIIACKNQNIVNLPESILARDLVACICFLL